MSIYKYFKENYPDGILLENGANITTFFGKLDFENNFDLFIRVENKNKIIFYKIFDFYKESEIKVKIAEKNEDKYIVKDKKINVSDYTKKVIFTIIKNYMKYYNYIKEIILENSTEIY